MIQPSSKNCVVTHQRKVPYNSLSEWSIFKIVFPGTGQQKYRRKKFDVGHQKLWPCCPINIVNFSTSVDHVTLDFEPPLIIGICLQFPVKLTPQQNKFNLGIAKRGKNMFKASFRIIVCRTAAIFTCCKSSFSTFIAGVVILLSLKLDLPKLFLFSVTYNLRKEGSTFLSC